MICQKCLTSRTGDVVGAQCKTQGCDGIIEETPAFSTLVDVLPEPMTCGRRRENGMDQANAPFNGSGPGLDRWQKFKRNGNRVCSYCGSLHPDDLFDLVKASAEAPETAPFDSVVEIEPSDKGYKIYIRQPGVRNAMEGGIKFYTQHLPRDEKGDLAVPPERQAEYNRAVHVSQVRFESHIYGMSKITTAIQ